MDFSLMPEFPANRNLLLTAHPRLVRWGRAGGSGRFGFGGPCLVAYVWWVWTKKSIEIPQVDECLWVCEWMWITTAPQMAPASRESCCVYSVEFKFSGLKPDHRGTLSTRANGDMTCGGMGDVVHQIWGFKWLDIKIPFLQQKREIIVIT